MKKKPYRTPELHLVNLDKIQNGKDLSSLSDEELLALLKQGNHEENKKLYVANSEYISRDIAGETILVPTNTYGDGLNGMITFNQAGVFMWEQLQEKRTEAELIHLFAKKYEKEDCEVEADVKMFLDGAVKRGFVTVCE